MHAVIMAGGRGARFWPRSREERPKHLLDITSRKTIIQETVDRIKSLVLPENILIVTGKKHSRTLIEQLPEIPLRNIIIEPEGKNTAPCIGLAALHIRKKVEDDIMIVLPSDHAIADSRKFVRVLKAAAKTASVNDALVTIGIKPFRPETGFGYIERGASLPNRSQEKIFRVKAIKEKPDFRHAKKFMESGRYYWNSGMFIWKASTILKSISLYLPLLYEGLSVIDKKLGSAGESATVKNVYKNISSISIDYGVMEKARNVFVVEGNFGWSDVGSWDALWEISAKDKNNNAFIGGGKVISEESGNSLVYSRQKLVALSGISDLIVVETEDALLICRRGNSQNVKDIVKALEKNNLKKYL